MSTATMAGPAQALLDPAALANKVNWLKALARKLLAAAAKPMEIVAAATKAAKDALAWTVSRIPAPIPLALTSLALATESGYERARNGFRWLGKAFVTVPTTILFWTGAITYGALDFGAQLITKIHASTGQALSKALAVGFDYAAATLMKVASFADSVVDNVYYALGHRFAVRFIKWASAALAAAAVAEFALGLPWFADTALFSVSGWLTSVLPASMSIIPAILTSTGVGLAVLGLVVASAAVGSWIMNRDDINDMIATDKALAVKEAQVASSDPIVDAVVDAEISQSLAQTVSLQAEKAAYEEVIRQAGHGGKKRNRQ